LMMSNGFPIAIPTLPAMKPDTKSADIEKEAFLGDYETA
jgi:hypothetical protein